MGSVVALLEDWARKWLKRMLLTSESVLKGDDDDALEELGASLAAWRLGLFVLLADFFSFVVKSFGPQPFAFSLPADAIIR